MCYRFPGTKWFIGRKELKRLMQSSYETFKKVCKFHSIPDSDWKLNGQYNYIEFVNGSRIDLLDVNFQPSDPLFERFGSTEYTGGWIEEAGEVHFKAFDVLKTRIGRHLNKEFNIHPKMLITCNPKKNWLKRLIWKPWKEGTLKTIYAYIQSLYSDNYYTADTYGEQLDEIADKITKQRLKGGDWNYDDDDNCLVDGDAIQDIWTNTVEEGKEKYATLDVARFGKDKIVMMLWRGWRVYKIIVWDNQDTGLTAIMAKDELSKEKIPFSHCIVDEVGVGSGVIDQMRGVKGFIANSSPLEDPNAEPVYKIVNGIKKRIFPKENFKSLKDQCGYRLADMINNHKISVDCKDEEIKEFIEEEISELKDFKPDEDSKKQLVPKDEIKEHIGRSPDFLDNLLMRIWFSLSDMVAPDIVPFKPEPELPGEYEGRVGSETSQAVEDINKQLHSSDEEVPTINEVYNPSVDDDLTA